MMGGRRSAGTKVWRVVGVLAFFALLTTFHTWPLVPQLSSSISPASDVRVNIWALNDLAGQMLRDPAHPFDGRIFYPYPRTLTFVDHQIANAVLAIPLVASGQDPITVYNVVLLSTFVLSGLFCYLLVRELTGSVPASLVAGCVYAFSSYRFFHFQHLHLLGTQWLPLALLALHRFLDRPTWKRLVGVAGSWLLVAFSSWQLAVIGTVGLLVAAVSTMLADGRPPLRRAGALALVVAIVGLTVAPLAVLYSASSNEWGRPGGETTGSRVDMSMRPDSFFTPAGSSRAPYAPLLRRIASVPPAFPGVVALLLAVPALGMLLRFRPGRTREWPLRVLFWLGCTPVIVALIAARSDEWSWVVDLLRPAAPVVIFVTTVVLFGVRFARRVRGADANVVVILTYLAIAVTGGVLALGPYVFVGDINLGRGVYWPDRVPPLSLLRAPERFTLLLTLGVSVLAGVGLTRLLRGRRIRTVGVVSALVLTALNLDAWQAPVPLDDGPPARPPVYTWLANAPEPGAVLEYPWNNHWSVYNNLDHGRRMVHGRAYIEPHRLSILKEWPALTPRHLDQLWEYVHPRFIVLRSGLYPPDVRAEIMRSVRARPNALRLRAQFGDDYVYELVDLGRGSRLYRIWPREELEHRQGFALTGRVAGGRDDTVPGLVATLNGSTILEHWGDAVTSAYPRVAWFDADHLIPGLNTLEIRADYRFRENAPAYPIGTTGRHLAADVVVTADRDQATVEVNGHLEEVDKGYSLTVLNATTGQVTNTGWFNTSWYREDSERMVDFIEDIPEGAPVIVASEFDVSRQLTPELVDALRTLGLRQDLTGRPNWVHAAIGVKGATPGSALEAVDRRRCRLVLGELARPHVELGGLSVH